MAEQNKDTTRDYLNNKDASYTSTKFINDAYALLDEFDSEENEGRLANSLTFQNKQEIKITIGAVPKFLSDIDKKTIQSNVLWFKYGEQVSSLVLEDNINSVGISGYMDIKNTGSFADIVLHRHDSFYIILNITLTISQDKRIKLEPYIFEINRVENLSPSGVEEKKMRIHLMDLMSAICNNHSFATIIKLNENITNRNTYKEVFVDILDYIKSYIKVNTVGKYNYRKDVYFKDAMELNEDIIGPEKMGNYKYEKDEKLKDDGAETLGSLVADTIAKIPQDATILEAITILKRDCGRKLVTPKHFTNKNQSIGDLIIPFFFKEEYPHMGDYYTKVWTEPDNTKQTVDINKILMIGEGNGFSEAMNEAKKINTVLTEENKNEKLKMNLNYGGKETLLLYRHISMRDIYMPFFLAFDNKGRENNDRGVYHIFESINPEKDENGKYTSDEMMFNVANGMRNNANILGFQSHPFDVDMVKKRWKNIIFVDTNNGTSAVMIYLRWFYDYFQNIFLNVNQMGNRRYICNIAPSFLYTSKSQKVGEANAEGETFDFLYDTHNSNIFICNTKDTRNEALREMGKNIASFILGNHKSTIKLEGNIFRRPNEIIKYSLTTNNKYSKKASQIISQGMNVTEDHYNLLYVTSVKHIFTENGFHNIIEGCKFADSRIEGSAALET